MLEQITENYVVPRCFHFGSCGGCKSQDLNYDSQLKEKALAVQDLFAEYFVQNQPIVGPENPWHYRNKMEYTFSQDKKGERFLGLIMAKSRGRVATLQECHLTPSWYIEVLQKVHAWWSQSSLHAFHARLDKGSLRNLIVRGSQNKLVMLVVSGNEQYALSKEDVTGFKQAAMLDKQTSVYLCVQKAVKGQVTTFSDEHIAGPQYLLEDMHIHGHAYTFAISPRAFFQPNTRMAERMYADIVSLLDLRGDEQLLDLYCGIGTIGSVLAAHVKEVIGVEINESAVEDAQRNIALNKINNMQVFAADVGKFLQGYSLGFRPDVIVVDPPRVGLDDKSIAYINETKPEKLIYVSCNPTSQKENIAALSGYQIEKIIPYDQFPHTRHVENIVLLKRCS